MTGKDILNALNEADEEYIDEARLRIKSKKSMIVKLSVSAACLLIAASGAFAGIRALNRSFKTKNAAEKAEEADEYEIIDYDWAFKGDLEANPGEAAGSTKVETDTTNSEIYVSKIPCWEERSIYDKFGEIKTSDGEYSATSIIVTKEKVGKLLEKITVSGTDEPYTEKTYTCNAEVYELKGFSSKAVAAVKYEGEKKLYICRSRSYKPQTLGQFINDLSLKSKLEFNRFHVTVKKKGTIREVVYNGWKTERIWELLNSFENAKLVNEDDIKWFEPAIQASINVSELGHENISLRVSKDGYLDTNILDTGKTFYIGEAAAESFIKYFETECKEKTLHTYDYSEPSYTEERGESASSEAATSHTSSCK